MLLLKMALPLFIVFCMVTSGLGNGSGNSGCVLPCQNGVCVTEGYFCACNAGWKGDACDIKSALQFFDIRSSMYYTYIPTKVSFKRAVEECLFKHFGKVVFNVSSSNVLQRLRSNQDFFNVIGTEAFWAIHGEYPSQLPHEREQNCPTSNLPGQLDVRRCNETMAALCVTPNRGYCPAVHEHRCRNSSKNVCEFFFINSPKIVCRCRSGLTFDEPTGKCKDINECDLSQTRGKRCELPTSCQNEYGTYRCVCPPGQQGNGNKTCGYLITLEQQNIDLSKFPTASRLTNSSTVSPMPTTRGLDDQQIKARIELKLKSLFLVSTKSIKKLMVKTINKTSFSSARAVYDVYVNDSNISPSSLLEFYREAERQSKLDWLIGSFPASGYPNCTPSTLRLGGEDYTFAESQPDVIVGSTEKCQDGRVKATAVCKSKKLADGSFMSFYDYKTVKALSCEVSVDNIAAQALQVESPEEVEAVMADLDTITADYKNLDKHQLNESLEAIKNVANYIWDEKVDISAEAMESMMKAVDNIDWSQKLDRELNNEIQLSDAQKNDIVDALERCSTHVVVEPSTSIRIETGSAILQATNAMLNSTENKVVDGVSFQVGATPQDTCSLASKPRVQAAINKDILTTAKVKIHQKNATLTALPVSFIYFVDSEFFPKDSHGNAVEEILSVRISNLQLENLENPLWFQMPSQLKESKLELRYYKCAYLEKKTGRWLSDGCKMVPGSDPPRCSCDHMTNFAMLVQTHPHMKEYTLEVFGKLFCCLSIIGLAMMLCIHLYFPSLRRSQLVKVHCHLGLCLLVTYVVFLTSTERSKPYNLCVASAAFLQFFLLSSWGWMLVECFMMYRKLVAVFQSDISLLLYKATLVVYSVSASITVLTSMISVVWYDWSNNDGWYNPDFDFYPSVYISDRLCWLHSYSLIFGFLIPVGVAFIINLVVSVLVLRAITWGRKKVSSSSKDKSNYCTYLVRTITISVLLGICWIFAIPLTLSDDPTVNTVFGWLFSITNALQGFFLFLLLCVRREDVRNLWLKEVKSLFKDNSESSHSRLFTGESGKDTQASSTIAGPVTVNTDSKKLPHSNDAAVVEETITVEAASEPREYVQLGDISTFHPT